jgi:uncharacterized protein YjbJ (UPF0337 family)
MNRDQMQGMWHEFKGKVKAKWGDLTDDDFAESEGRMEELVGRIQRRYGGTREDIQRELNNL